MFITDVQTPEQPTNVTVVYVSSSSATIQWTVTLISYTPEQYVVQFGLRQNQLNQTGFTVNGNQNLSVVNETHTVVIDALLPDTTYYFRVVARNAFGSTHSRIGAFTTLLIQKGNFVLFYEYLNCKR